jgi:CHASE2 domain-containing sensor protein
MINPFDFSLIQAKTLLIIVLIMFSLTVPLGAVAFRSGNKRLITTTWVLFVGGLLVISLYLLLYVGWIAWSPLLPVLLIILIIYKK